MIFTHGETVTLLPRVEGAVDRYGAVTYTWPGPGVAVSPCGFDPGTSVESAVPYRTTVNTQPTVYMPAGTSVKATDRVIVRGVTFDVDGDPGVYVNPFTGWAPGVEVKLTRSEG